MKSISHTPASGVVRHLPVAPDRGNLTVGQAAAAFMSVYAGRDRSRAGTLAFWVRHLGDIPLAELTPDQIADVLDHYAASPVTKILTTGKRAERKLGLRTHGQRAPATINRVRSVLSGLYSWALKKRMLPRGFHNPVHDVAPEEVDNSRCRYLTNDERERLLAVARTNAWPRMFLLVLLALTTGGRRGELLGLRYRDIDLERGVAFLHTSKNGERRTLPLTEEVVTEIKRFGKAAPESLLFESRRKPGTAMIVNKTFVALVAEARITDFHFHDLRHSCASYLAMSGASLLEVADVLGHKSIQMTQRYAHLSNDHKSKLVNRVLGNLGRAA